MKRIIFLIHDGKLYLSETDMDHLQYAMQLRLVMRLRDPRYESIVRGVIHDNKVRIYQGSLYRLPDPMHNLGPALMELQQRLALADDMEVIYGVLADGVVRRIKNVANQTLEQIKCRTR